jgi:hypothetical protein
MRNLGLLLLLGATLCHAAVQKIYVEERTDVLGGKSFGAAGPYERIRARAYFTADPANPNNKIVRDLGLAPKNEQGFVEWSADLYVLKPRDPAKGNGTVLFEVSNRGNKGMLSMFNLAQSSPDPKSEEHFGDRMLLEQGYTIVWLGWQWDVADRADLMRAYVPKTTGVKGKVRSQFVPLTATNLMWLADRDHKPYPVEDPSKAQLTLIRKFGETPEVIPAAKWKLRNPLTLEMAEGFQPGVMYEFVYESTNPVVAGLGLAGIRDLISFLKYGGPGTLLADQRRHIKRAIGFGTSQSGRLLRTFLYDGFNADEQGRKVFDGLWPHVAGAGVGAFNVRFAQPSRDHQPNANWFYPVDIFPFTDLDQTDPESSLTDGLIRRAVAAKVLPRIFYTNGSYEYWGRAASLIHTTPDGQKDAPLGDHQRVFFMTGAQHGAGGFPPQRSTTVHLANPLDYRYAMRGLLAALNAWITDGTEPPPSMYPKVADGQLIPPAEVRLPFEVKPPYRAVSAWRLDFGPNFRSEGVATIEPPTRKGAFGVRVPRLNEFGNEVGGLRLPELHAPLATYTGWNFPDVQTPARNEAIAFIGSFFPLRAAAPGPGAPPSAREDKRPTIEDTYLTQSRYTEQYRTALETLISQRYLLQRDYDALLTRAGKLWEFVQTPQPTTASR